MVSITSPSRLINQGRVTLQRLKSLRQKLRTYGTYAQNGTRKYFHGTRLSLLSLSLIFFKFLLPDQRLYIVNNMCAYIHMSDWLRKIVHELPLLPNNIASETLLQMERWELLNGCLSLRRPPGSEWASTRH